MVKSETKRGIVLAVITFGVIIGIEEIFYKRNEKWINNDPETYEGDALYIKNEFAQKLLRYIILWGFGDYLNLLTILAYSATL